MQTFANSKAYNLPSRNPHLNQVTKFDFRSLTWRTIEAKVNNRAGSRERKILRTRSNRTRSTSRNHRATNKNDGPPAVEKNIRAIQKSVAHPAKNRKTRATRTKRSLRPSQH